MNAPLQFVALIALSRETRVAAGASSAARLLKVAEVGAGCPSFAESARWRRLESKEGRHAPRRRFRLGTQPRLKSISQARPSSSDHSRSQKLQGHFGAIHAVHLASVGMLRHPDENTNTKHGCGSASVA
jgi:hypothetical protein